MTSRTLVIGAGIFGITAALELRQRGHRVHVLDPGPIPHPLAASTDISKVIRIEYGQDETYMALMEEAREGWLKWNQEWIADGEDPLYRETGVVMVSRAPMTRGAFEYESWETLTKRGHHPVRIVGQEIRRRFPAWSTGRYVDGFFHEKGGYAESGRVVTALAHRAKRAGVELSEGRSMGELLVDHGRVVGVQDSSGTRYRSDGVVVAAGAWTGKLIRGLGKAIRPTGHPIFHLRPEDPGPFRAERFPTFTADVARTGYYGFPVNRDGVVKIANHGVGTPLDPDAPRVVSQRDHQRLRTFLEETFPALLDAPVVFTRLCLYADTQDGDFWIARDPERPGLIVASGGSGHGFKFAPVLGGVIADALEGTTNAWSEKFRWRPEVSLNHGREEARCQVEGEVGEG